MEKAFAKAGEMIDTVKEYINTRIQSMKLSAAEKSSRLIATLLAGIAVGVMFLFFIIFAGIALSFVIGEWIGKPWAGFLIVALLYLLIGLIIWAGRRKLIHLPLMNIFIQQLFNEDEED